MENNNKIKMMLESSSGFAMPFTSVAAKGEEVQCTLPYGEQVHPHTGEKFLHSGWDLNANHVPLQALATGIVVGIGNDNTHDNFIVIRYGKYEVKYGHLSEAYVNYGTNVVAGQLVALSGNFLHLGVRFEGREIDPKDLISMLYINIQQLELMGMPPSVQPSISSSVKTAYEGDMEEIMNLMTQYLPEYFKAIMEGQYRPPQRTDQTLRNIFAQSAEKNYFFESIPNIANPLGLSDRANPMVAKMQTLLISDFLNYLALHKNIFLTTWSDDEKKKYLSKQSATEQ